MSSKYIFDNNKEFEIFLPVEKVLNKNEFPIMSEIANEEISFLNKQLNKNDYFLEIGCGGGRILKQIKKRVNIFGIEIDKLFVKYCKKSGFEVLNLNILEDISENFEQKFDSILLAYNLLFNFPEDARLRIINNCNLLFKKGGKLIITFFQVEKSKQIKIFKVK